MKKRYLNPQNIWRDFCTSYNIKVRNHKLKVRKEKLINKSFSIFSDNCTGGVVCHDLGVPFKSPLINGAFSPDDYLKFLERPEYYLNLELEFVPINDDSVPEFYRCNHFVAKIGDIHYRFTHYDKYTEDRIRNLWKRLKSRINWENLFVILCQKEGVTLEHMMRFEALPYKNKLILTYRDYPELKCSFCLKGYEEIGYIDNLLKYMPGFMKGMKYYDQFDWVEWVNTGKIMAFKNRKL